MQAAIQASVLETDGRGTARREITREMALGSHCNSREMDAPVHGCISILRAAQFIDLMQNSSFLIQNSSFKCQIYHFYSLRFNGARPSLCITSSLSETSLEI